MAIVKKFDHKGHLCVITEMDYYGHFHNGYVEMPKPKRREFNKFGPKRLHDVTYHRFHKYNLPEEPTYSDFGIGGEMEDKYFIGFHTNHQYNVKHPLTQTESYVTVSLKKFVDALIDVGLLEDMEGDG